MKKIILSISLIFAVFAAVTAQELAVKSFECLVNDLAASVNPQYDLNGEECALIRVSVALKNPDIRGNLGNVGEVFSLHPSQYCLYVPAGTKSILINHPDYLPLTYTFKLKIEKKRTYELRLALPDRSGPVKQALESQFLALKVDPVSATVLIDNMMRSLTDGQLFLELPFGRHTYQVAAPMYHTQSGEFEISGKGRTDLQISLKPAYGTLKVTSTPSGATVMVDGEVKGTAPCSMKLERGDHFVQVMSEGYIAYGQNVTLTDGATLPLAAALRANFSQVTLKAPHANSEIWLGGEKIGTGQWSGRLNAGTYSVEVRTEGYETSIQNIEVLAGTPKSYTLTGAHAIYGVLKVTSSPMGATVKLDGKVLGTTPFMSNEVLTGNRTLALELKGYNPYTKELSIVKGKTTEVAATLSNEPVYKVGDLYRRGNKVGIIFEVDATGRKGKIVDLGFYGPGEQDNREDALKVIKKTKGDDWRLPSINELKAMYTYKSLLEPVLPELYRDYSKNESDNAWLSSYYKINDSRSVRLNSGKVIKNSYAIDRICMVTSFDITTEPATKSEVNRTYKVGEVYAENGIRGIVYDCNRSTGAVKIVAPYMIETEKESHPLVDPRWRLPSEEEIKKIEQAGIYKNPPGVYLSDGYRYNPTRARYLNFRLLFVAIIAPNPYIDQEASMNGELFYKTTQGPYKVGDFYNEGGLFGVVFRANGAGDKVWLVGMNKRHNPGLGAIPSKEQQEILKGKLSTINQTLELFEGSEPMTEKSLSNYMVTRNFEYDYEPGDYCDEAGKEGVVIATNEWGTTTLVVSLKQAGPMQWYTGSKFPKSKGGSTLEEKIQSIKGWQTKFPLYDFARKLPSGWFVPGKEHEEEAKIFANLLNNSTLLQAVNRVLRSHGGDPIETDREYWQLDAYISEYGKSDDADAIARSYRNNKMFAIGQDRAPDQFLYVRPLAQLRSTSPIRKRTIGDGVPNLSALNLWKKASPATKASSASAGVTSQKESKSTSIFNTPK